MSSIEDIWASMNESNGTVKPKVTSSVKKSKKTKEKGADKKTNINSPIISKEKEILDYATMTTKIARDIQSCEENEIGVRKRALTTLHSVLFNDFDMTEDGYNEVFRDVCKKIFKRFADPSEKCRELAQKITASFFERCSDIVPTLGYYFPALLQRIPSGSGYDEDMKVFVSNLEEHDAYRRGRAVDRQDRAGTIGTVTHTVVEPSEEIRLHNCNTLFTLIKRVCTIGACPVLHPYFQEIIMFLQIQLKDPYPDLKVTACQTLELLAHTSEYEQGMKFFAVGLVRAILPVLRHRLAKVRVAAVAATHACMVVPDRAKRKASGSEAITDLVGFREDNVLPIASFYKAEVQVNHLAELVIDKSLPVREELAKFLFTLLTEIGDRYDHHTRLLPYVLDLMTDENPAVAATALSTLQACGREYESEHEDEIRDRRQYGVDGDDRINLDKPLPAPFTERPRIGMRLYIRGLSKRFLAALVAELTNWVSTTRLKSAQLLKLLVVLCEEHLTMEAHTLFPSFIKAMKFAYDDKDQVLYTTLKELFELLGRYIQPEVYIYYILPRLRGDKEVVAFGVDTATRVVVLDFLQALLTGSKAAMVVPHLDELVSTLTDPFVVPFDSPSMQTAAVEELITIFQAVKGRGTKVIEAHYLNTGRLSTLHSTVRRAFRFLLLQLSSPSLVTRAWEALTLLAQLESDHGMGVAFLYRQHAVPLLLECLSDYEVDAQWSAASCAEHLLLCRLISPPPITTTTTAATTTTTTTVSMSAAQRFVVQADEAAMAKLLEFLCSVHMTDLSMSTEAETALLCGVSELLQSTLAPLSNPSSCSLFTTSRDVVTRAVPRILHAFVYDTRWSCSAALLEHSLHIVALLVQAPLQLQCKHDHLTKLYYNLQTDMEKHSNTDATIVQNTSECVYLCETALVQHTDRILHTILTTALTPSFPVSLRQNTLLVMEQIVVVLKTYAGRSKLKSFAFYEGSSPVLPNIGEIVPEPVLRVVACKLSMQRGLSHLLAGLNDSDDNVRNNCLQVLNTIAPLLLSETECIRLRSTDKNDSFIQQLRSVTNTQLDIGSNELVSVDYQHLITILLQQALLSTDSSCDFMAYMNDTLRVYCVLNPRKFEEIVRVELIPVMAKKDEGSTSLLVTQRLSGDALNEFVSGLLNHVDVLLQFSS